MPYHERGTSQQASAGHKSTAECPGHTAGLFPAVIEDVSTDGRNNLTEGVNIPAEKEDVPIDERIVPPKNGNLASST